MESKQEYFSPLSDEVLGAYLDNELDEIRRLEVEAALALNPEAAKFVEDGARLRSGIHRLFDGLLGRPLPVDHERLVQEFERRLQNAQRHRTVRPVLVGGGVVLAALLGVAVLAPYFSSSDPAQPLFALFQQHRGEEAANVVAAGQKDDSKVALVANGAAATEATGAAAEDQPRKPGAPDLSQFGFQLISTRLLAKKDGRSMQLIYESPEGSRVELFFSPSDPAQKGAEPKTSLTVMEEGAISVLFWHDQGRSYSLIGEVGRDTLVSMGQVVNGQWTIDLPTGAAVPESGSAGPKKMEANSIGDSPAPGAERKSGEAERPAEPAPMPPAKVPEESNGDKSTDRKNT